MYVCICYLAQRASTLLVPNASSKKWVAAHEGEREKEKAGYRVSRRLRSNFRSRAENERPVSRFNRESFDDYGKPPTTKESNGRS